MASPTALLPSSVLNQFITFIIKALEIRLLKEVTSYENTPFCVKIIFINLLFVVIFLSLLWTLVSILKTQYYANYTTLLEFLNIMSPVFLEYVNSNYNT